MPEDSGFRPRPASADAYCTGLASLGLLKRFFCFCCCPVGLYVSAPSGLAPPSSGPAVQKMSLRRSFVADFLREFPAPCPMGRQASVVHSSASFASSKNKGRGKAGRSPTPPATVCASTRFQPLDRHRSVGGEANLLAHHTAPCTS